MKKILIYLSLVIIIFLTVGCQMDNTPTKKVETYLNNYKSLDETVLTQLDTVVNADVLMSATQKTSYKDILKKQYEDLTYTIKDETINGDTATVKVEVEVYDFYKLTKESDNYYTTNPNEFKDDAGNITESKYIDYKLNKMKDYKERVTYTIDFYLKKVDKTWVLEDISEDVRQKIHGLYAY